MTIVHELGHALGLGHLPVSGNVMSYNYVTGVAETWKPSMSVLLAITLALQGAAAGVDSSNLGSWMPNYDGIPFVYRHDDMFPYMLVTRSDQLSFMALFNETIKLGEQDKMALLCSYDFSNWNH